MVASRFAYKGSAKASIISMAKKPIDPFAQPPTEQQQTDDTQSKLLLEILKKLDSLERHESYHFNDQTDIRFDHAGFIFTALLPAAVGGEALMLQYPVPVGQKLIIESMKFFGEVNNQPVVAYDIFAEPFELSGIFNFRVKKNNKEIMFNRYQLFTPGGIQVFDLIPYYAQTFEQFSDPKMAITIPGGETLQVFAVRVSLNAVFRPLNGLMCRIQGFLTNKDSGRTESPSI